MIRFVPHLFVALALSLIETSFFGSLHGLFRFTPFVLVTSVYLLQHHGVKASIFWMILHGILLDVSGASIIPFVTLAYFLTACVAYLSAERLFSNRSFYGVVACTFLSYITFEISSGFLRIASAFIQKNTWHLETYFLDAIDRAFTVCIFLIVLYSCAKHIRHVLIKLFLISPSRQTY